MALRLFFCMESRATLLVGGSNDVGQSLQHAKVVYAKDIMHIHMQMKAANIYMAYIYMNAGLGLGVYGPYTCIYGDIEACAQSGANIYIYTCLNLGAQGQI